MITLLSLFLTAHAGGKTTESIAHGVETHSQGLAISSLDERLLFGKGSTCEEAMAEALKPLTKITAKGYVPLYIGDKEHPYLDRSDVLSCSGKKNKWKVNATAVSGRDQGPIQFSGGQVEQLVSVMTPFVPPVVNLSVMPVFGKLGNTMIRGQQGLSSVSITQQEGMTLITGPTITIGPVSTKVKPIPMAHRAWAEQAATISRQAGTILDAFPELDAVHTHLSIRRENPKNPDAEPDNAHFDVVLSRPVVQALLAGATPGEVAREVVMFQQVQSTLNADQALGSMVMGARPKEALAAASDNRNRIPLRYPDTPEPPPPAPPPELPMDGVQPTPAQASE